MTTPNTVILGEHQICSLDAATIARLVRARELSPIEVVEVVLARQAALDPLLCAFCSPTPDLARRMAQKLERSLAAGKPVGPLAGVPVAIKDLIATKDVRTTGGSRLYADFMPEEDDIVVERLVAAGAVILGKTNVAELGYGGIGHNPLFPATRNPWAPELTSGGSSAGSAVAVATGMAPVALGSDGGGSIRIPAALCGVVGFKPSMGRVPLYPGCRDERFPGFSGWESIEHIGPLCRTVADVGLVTSVIAGPDLRDRHSLPAGDVDWVGALAGDLHGLRVAFSSDWGYAAVDPEVRAVATHAAQVFERDLGCTVEEAHPGFSDPAGCFEALVALETDLSGMERLIEERPGAVSPHIVAMVRRPWTGREFSDAIVARKCVVNLMWRFMQRYDLLLTPTVATPAFPIGLDGPPEIDGHPSGPQSWTPFAFIMNLTGQPAISVPAGFTRSGLPVGLQIAGPHLADELVLRAAASFETAAPWAHLWPQTCRP
jgi:aspartyl-tRNA(Asn)/glutamyl-tRNA(Gln) amidotransferase subunit A